MQEAIPSPADPKKLKGILDEINICIFTTADKEKKQNCSTLMPNSHVDDDGTIWFFTDKKSRRRSAIESNGNVHLLYTHPSKKNYVDVWGNARMVEDGGKINELWNPIVTAWFPDGKQKTEVCLIKVEPQKANYWDSTTNESVSFF